MRSHVAKTLENLKSFFEETFEGVKTKDKDVEGDVKTLITVKEATEIVQKRNEEIILSLDQLDESLKMFQTHEIAKDSQIKQSKKLFDEWAKLKKAARETKKEIAPYVEAESDKVKNQIRTLEDNLKTYTAELKKRDFY